MNLTYTFEKYTVIENFVWSGSHCKGFLQSCCWWQESFVIGEWLCDSIHGCRRCRNLMTLVQWASADSLSADWIPCLYVRYNLQQVSDLICAEANSAYYRYRNHGRNHWGSGRGVWTPKFGRTPNFLLSFLMNRVWLCNRLYQTG